MTVCLLLVIGPFFSLIWPILAQLAISYGALTQIVLLLVESVALLEGHVSLGIFLILVLIELDQIRRIGEATSILLVDLARLVRVEVLGREVYILWKVALAIQLLGLKRSGSRVVDVSLMCLFLCRLREQVLLKLLSFKLLVGLGMGGVHGIGV